MADVSNSIMNNNVYLNNVKAWRERVKGYFEEVTENVCKLNKRMDQDTLYFNTL